MKFTKKHIQMIIIAIAFITGFYSYKPVHKGLIRIKVKREKLLKKRNLSENFLNKKVPDLVTTTIDGNEWRLRDQNGKVLLILFWSAQCGHCRENIPDMIKIYEKYKTNDEFLMIGVSLDQDKDILLGYSIIKKIPWLQLYEEEKGWKNSFALAFNIHYIPSIWIIDKEGKIIGINLKLKEAEELLANVLNKN